MSGAAVSPEPPQPGSPPRLQVLSERPAPPRRIEPARTVEQPSQPASRDRTVAAPNPGLAAVLGTFRAIAALLAVRLLLLLGSAGAFVLALRAVDWISITALGMFCGLVIIPLIWLDHTVRRGPTA